VKVLALLHWKLLHVEHLWLRMLWAGFSPSSNMVARGSWWQIASQMFLHGTSHKFLMTLH
jgi:hypothetical protein